MSALFTAGSLIMNEVFIWRSRTGNLYLFSTLLFVLIFLIILWDDNRRYIVLGLLFGMLYLTKLGLVAFPLLIFIIYEFYYQKDPLVKRSYHYILLIISAVFLPFYLALYRNFSNR